MQRNEHKAALVKTGMRHLEAGFADDVRAVEQQIEIEGTRAIGLLTDAPL